MAALERRSPFSAIRIGDGEGNILSYDVFSDTPNLDDFALERSVAIQPDSFQIETLWMSILQEMMLSSILQADMVGVMGLWRFRHRSATERVDEYLKRFSSPSDLRGQVGQFKGVHAVMQLASKGVLKEKILASAHFYFSILSHMEQLFTAAEKVIAVTNNKNAGDVLRERYPARPIIEIPVGIPTQKEGPPSTKPDFLQKVRTSLPEDLRGCFCLVGAGIWAEIYCSWIKQKGGVAVDFGSGFDLLAGRMTRPVHRTVLGESWDGDLSTLNRLQGSGDRFIPRRIIGSIKHALSAVRHR